MWFHLCLEVSLGVDSGMVHVEISDYLHYELCRLKHKARDYWNSYEGCPKRKGKVSIEEVISWLYYSHD